ncbi:MAG: GNAT family N-acetyltransferase [Prolixibacteraceae bacterium]|nr:GNAT family N-acetyltransferase [Prolixibacteraceae bacterium]
MDKRIDYIDLQNKTHCKNLLKLLNAYMEDEMGVGEPMPGHLDRIVIEGLKKHTGYRGFFVTCKNEYVALANCNLNFGTFNAKPLLNIHDFVVLPEYRNLGIGKFLMEKITVFATDNGCSKLTLEVRNDNTKAKNLYRKSGFSEGDPPYLFWEKKL